MLRKLRLRQKNSVLIKKRVYQTCLRALLFQKIYQLIFENLGGPLVLPNNVQLKWYERLLPSKAVCDFIFMDRYLMVS